jgi:copper transport protein
LQLSFKNSYFSPVSSRIVFMIATALLSVFLVLCISFAIEAFAHPFYVDSTPKPFQNTPEPPGEVSVFFSEPIELPYSDISVLGPDGKSVDNKDAHNVNGETSSIAVSLQNNLPSGIYTVNTKVLSAVDGHVVDNSFTFGVATDLTSGSNVEAGEGGNQLAGLSGRQSEKDILSIEESLSRFPGYVGQVIAFGVAFAIIWLWKPFKQIPWLFELLAPFRNQLSKVATKILIVGASLILVSGIAMIIVQSASVDATIFEIISTKFGNVWSIRMIQASALLLLTISIFRKSTKRGQHVGTAEISAVLALALSLLVTYSLIAHAAASNLPLAILADFCHSIVASIWIGGVIFLAFAFIPKLASLHVNDSVKATVISILIPRFSTVVVVSLGIILMTGPLLLWTLENDLEITLASLYGRVLLGKLSIGLVMIAMGGYHQFLTQKKFGSLLVSTTSIASSTNKRSGSENSSDTDSNAQFLTSFRRLDKAIKIEAALGVGLLFMVSLMANMALPSGEFPAYERANAEDITELGTAASASLPNEKEFSEIAYLANGNRIQLNIKPFTLGQNTFEVTYYDSNNSIARFINSSTIKLTQVERGIGPIEVDMSNQSLGVFSVDTAFSLAGKWTVQVLGESIRQGTPNMVGIFDVDVKPSLSELQFSIEEYKTPQPSLPLYPIYDALTRKIWVGDSMPGSGRLWEFDIESENYMSHPINNVSLITTTSIGNDGKIWYLDPTKSIVGNYDPKTNGTEQYTIPIEGVPSGMAIDLRQQEDVWLAVGGQSNSIVKLSPSSGNFTLFEIPTPDSLPTSVAVDSQGYVWFTESIGKVGRLDPVSGNITEYQPSDTSLEEPTAILPDPESSNVYISEHEGKAISVLDPVLNLFYGYPAVNPDGLPFGMTLDAYGNVWFAQHVIDEIGVLDTTNGEISEVKVPTRGSFVQWLVPDDQGRIWFAEQRGSSLGAISMVLVPESVSPASGQVPLDQPRNDNGSVGEGEDTAVTTGTGASSLPVGLGYEDLLGPLIAAGVIAAAILYSKNVINLSRNVEIVNSIHSRQ